MYILSSPLNSPFQYFILLFFLCLSCFTKKAKCSAMGGRESGGMWWLMVVLLVVKVEGASWCVAKGNVNQTALQTALDYACGNGADCAPIQSSGLCYLPNTLEAHATYAFNSYYQRKSQVPGSCDFAGSATVSMTDPSYGSCVFPSSPSNAGGGGTGPVTPTPPNDPNAPPLLPGSPTSAGGSGAGGSSPPLLPDSPTAGTPRSWLPSSTSIILLFSFISLLPLLMQTL